MGSQTSSPKTPTGRPLPDDDDINPFTAEFRTAEEAEEYHNKQRERIYNESPSRIVTHKDLSEKKWQQKSILEQKREIRKEIEEKPYESEEWVSEDESGEFTDKPVERKLFPKKKKKKEKKEKKNEAATDPWLGAIAVGSVVIMPALDASESEEEEEEEVVVVSRSGLDFWTTGPVKDVPEATFDEKRGGRGGGGEA